MADLTQTAANVKPGSSSTTILGVTYGATVTQGMPLYLDSADNEYKPADADAAATALAKGIAITPGGDGEHGLMVTDGPTNVGATLVVGETYVVSTTTGAIAPIGDMGSGDFVRILGQASTAALLDVELAGGTVAKA